MSENSPVKEKECDSRRADLYSKYQALKEDLDKMKGALIVMKYILPAMIVVLGLYVRSIVNNAISEKRITSGSASAASFQESTESVKFEIKEVDENEFILNDTMTGD